MPTENPIRYPIEVPNSNPYEDPVTIPIKVPNRSSIDVTNNVSS